LLLLFLKYGELTSSLILICFQNTWNWQFFEKAKKTTTQHLVSTFNFLSRLVPFEKIRFGMVTTDNRLESQILFGSEFSKNLTSKKSKKNILKKLPGF